MEKIIPMMIMMIINLFDDSNQNDWTWKATLYAGGTMEKLMAAAGSMKQYLA